jgi:hypothetical protein
MYSTKGSPTLPIIPYFSEHVYHFDAQHEQETAHLRIEDLGYLIQAKVSDSARHMGLEMLDDTSLRLRGRKTRQAKWRHYFGKVLIGMIVV